MEDFSGVDTSDPNCVVIGDCAEHFTFSKLNDAFQVRRGKGGGIENILFVKVLLKPDKPTLFSLGKGKFYREDSSLQLDVGPFAAGIDC